MANHSSFTYDNTALFDRRPLRFDPWLTRNLRNLLFTSIACIFAAIAVLPLLLVLFHVLMQGGRLISVSLFTQLPPPPA